MRNRSRHHVIIALAVTATVAATGAMPAAATADRQSYIVQVAPTSRAAVEATAQGLGGDIGFRYQYALQGFSVTLPVQAADALARTPGVVSVSPDGIMSVDADVTQTGATWGIDRTDQRDLPLSGTYTYAASAGTGVRAYIIDTGILSTHTDFGGRVISGYTAISDSYGTTDCNGHGTHVSGTVGGSKYGLAKNVTLVPVRVLGCNGSGSTSGVIAGVDWVTGQKTANPSIPMVANMSLGGGAYSPLDTAVNNAVDAGVVMAVAAGNSSTDACTASPARAAKALTVGATSSSDAQASFSNYGTCVDLYAPGVSITSDYYSSTTAAASMSGTSMASPHVAGAAALYLGAHAGATAADAIADLVSNATPGKVTSLGAGSPNLLLYSGFITDGPVTPTAPATPANFRAAAGDGHVDLSWSAVSNATSYEISVDGGAAISTTGTTYTVSSLTNGQLYNFSLVAKNDIGTSAPTTASATPIVLSVPSAPQSPTATGGSKLIRVQWLAPSNDGGSPITSYTVRLFLYPGGTVPVKTLTGVTTLSATFNGLKRSTQYYATVVAVNAVGASPAASTGAATTLAR